MGKHRNVKMAEFRRQKREEGFAESTIWLSPEERQLVERQSVAMGVTKSDIIRLALRKAFEQETTMNQAG